MSVSTEVPDRAEERKHAGTPPVLVDGTELVGEFEGSGFKQPPGLVRRVDGQIIQFPPLLYELLRAVDGQRDYRALAREVGERVKRTLTAGDVAFLIDEKLRPQGLVVAADGTAPRLERPDPFLAFRYRLGVVSEATSNRVGNVFKPLFNPLVMVLVLAGLVLSDWWLFFDRGVAQALRQTINHPGLFLLLLLAVVVSAAFHEIGHASACRYGGALPGRMGCGLYLAWPAFYTDVSDVYRLNRRGRLRTDLGGVYFNAVLIVAATVIYLFSQNLDVLVLLVVIEHMEIAHQLIPVIRLDGYYVVSDLTGVPDLFARIGPILRSLAFWRTPDPRVVVLKRWVRAAVTGWVLVVIPLLCLEMLIVLIHLPRILGSSWHSGDHLAHAGADAFSSQRVLQGASDWGQIVVLCIPIVGMILMVGQLLRKLAAWGWRSTRGRPVRRTLVLTALTAGAVILALSWIPGRNYRPIGPHERGTQGQGLHALFTVIGGPGPLYSAYAAHDVSWSGHAITHGRGGPATPSGLGAPAEAGAGTNGAYGPSAGPGGGNSALAGSSSGLGQGGSTLDGNEPGGVVQGILPLLNLRPAAQSEQTFPTGLSLLAFAGPLQSGPQVPTLIPNAPSNLTLPVNSGPTLSIPPVSPTLPPLTNPTTPTTATTPATSTVPGTSPQTSPGTSPQTTPGTSPQTTPVTSAPTTPASSTSTTPQATAP